MSGRRAGVVCASLTNSRIFECLTAAVGGSSFDAAAIPFCTGFLREKFSNNEVKGFESNLKRVYSFVQFHPPLEIQKRICYLKNRTE